MIARLGLGAVGVLVAAYGVFRLLELGWDNLVATVVWLAGGVVLHDAVLAPLVITVCALAVLVLPTRAGRAAAAGGLLVLGTVTLTAVPVLGRFGAKPDNPTLLDRPYVAGWLLLAGLVVLGAVLAGWWGTRRGRRPDPVGGPGRRGSCGSLTRSGVSASVEHVFGLGLVLRLGTGS